jgi:glycosyltransferase involved in cell wall biosynthesis
MDNSLKVSVITPSYNQGKFIERTILSVLEQHISDLEYFVIDAASKDETVSILEKYQDKLQFVSEPDEGQTDALNKGFKKAMGDIIGWLNSDDIYYPDSIKTVVTFFAENPEIDVVYGQANYIDEQDQFITPYLTNPRKWDFNRLKSSCYLAQPAVFFRRRVFEKCGMPDKSLNFCMDYEFWLRLALRGVKFCYIPQVFAGVRFYPQTKTNQYAPKFRMETMQMCHRTLGYVPGRAILSYAAIIIKSKHNYHFPHPVFCFAILITAFKESMHWNGLWRGFFIWLSMPWTAFKIILEKKGLLKQLNWFY